MEKQKTAMITGSFDPVTSGHMDLLRRASVMFDTVYAVIVFNTEKSTGAFTPGQRLELLDAAIRNEGLGNVKAVLHIGLTSDAAKALGAGVLVRGARSSTDFDYEYSLSQIMKRFDPELETVILPASPELSMISSTYVRDLLKYGCELGNAVPEGCGDMMKKLYKKE